MVCDLFITFNCWYELTHYVQAIRGSLKLLLIATLLNLQNQVLIIEEESSIKINGHSLIITGVLEFLYFSPAIHLYFIVSYSDLEEKPWLYKNFEWMKQ